MRLNVRLWVCPTEGCGDYYASSSTANLDLGEQLNYQGDLLHDRNHRPRYPIVTGNRGQCPDCKGRGKLVQRVAVDLNIELPVAVAA